MWRVRHWMTSARIASAASTALLSIACSSSATHNGVTGIHATRAICFRGTIRQQSRVATKTRSLGRQGF